MGEQTLTPAVPHLLVSIPSFFSLTPSACPSHCALISQTLTFSLPFTWTALPTLQVYPKLPQRRHWEMLFLSLLRYSNAQLEWFQVFSSRVFVGKQLLHFNLFCIIVTCFHFSGKSDHAQPLSALRPWISTLATLPSFVRGRRITLAFKQVFHSFSFRIAGW